MKGLEGPFREAFLARVIEVELFAGGNAVMWMSVSDVLEVAEGKEPVSVMTSASIVLVTTPVGASMVGVGVETIPESVVIAVLV